MLKVETISGTLDDHQLRARFRADGIKVESESDSTSMYGSMYSIGSIDSSGLYVATGSSQNSLTYQSRMDSTSLDFYDGSQSTLYARYSNSGISFSGSSFYNSSTGLLNATTVKFSGDLIKHDSVKNEDLDLIQASELLIPFGTEIVANKNLNTPEFLNVGRYYCPSYSTVVTLTNCPTNGESFVMTVRNITGDYTDTQNRTWMYLVRELVTLGGNRYIQYCQSGGSVSWTFSDWKRIVTNGEVLGSGKNLNDYDYSRAGIYELQSGMSNSPLTWGCLVVGGHAGSHQLAFNYSSGIYIRSKTGSPLAWTRWRQVVTDIVEKATYANTSVKKGALIARRQGNVVSINSADDAVSVTANTWVAYVQLGERYRPNETVYVPAANVGTAFSRWIRIAPDGWVYLFSTTAVGSTSNFGFSTSYIVD